jgi:protein-tyrosine phosphatase
MLAAGEYPGTASEATTVKKLERFLDAGVRTFIDLTEEHELRPYLPDLEALTGARGFEVQYHRMPIKDLGVPSEPHLRASLELIDRSVADGRPAYVHCWGGIGRTGTVVGCWLSRHGCAGQAALDRIAELRAGTPDSFTRSPETYAQRALVLDFASDDPQQPETPR